MAKVVYKYELSLHDVVALTLPVEAEILCVQTQREVPCLWARVDLDAQDGTIVRHFRVAGTGHPLRDANEKYIGTFQLQGGAFIGHVFEREE